MNDASLVVAHTSVLTDGIREHASVVFPAESHAEKEGTVIHPDGRIQRLRSAIAHPGAVEAGWAVLAEVGRRVGFDFEALTSADVFEQMTAAIPSFAGLTLDEIGGRGIRWPEREQASAHPIGGSDTPPPPIGAQAVAEPGPAPGQARTPANGHLRLGTYRSIWASPEVEISPALKFLAPRQQVELSPEDAQRLGVANGEAVEVAANGTRLRATAAVRTGVRPGTAFVADGLDRDSGNELSETLVEVLKA
jgi:NADH-quinone oxidoreductase subunit G